MLMKIARIQRARVRSRMFLLLPLLLLPFSCQEPAFDRFDPDAVFNSMSNCASAVAPLLPELSYSQQEVPDPCMTLWARKSHSIGRFAPTAAINRLTSEKLAEMNAASPFHYIVHSGYRSYDVQVSVFENWVQDELRKSGYNPSTGKYNITRSEAERRANAHSARAGESEHQLGTTMDLTVSRIPDPFNTSNGSPFGNSCEGQWLRAFAYKYGFVQSYHWGKESVTCYDSEPWHWRYVGVEVATELKRRNITLDEYFRRETGITPPRIECPQTVPAFKYDHKNWCAGYGIDFSEADLNDEDPVEPIDPPNDDDNDNDDDKPNIPIVVPNDPGNNDNDNVTPIDHGPTAEDLRVCGGVKKYQTTCLDSQRACVNGRLVHCEGRCAKAATTAGQDQCTTLSSCDLQLSQFRVCALGGKAICHKGKIEGCRNGCEQTSVAPPIAACR